MQFLMRTNEPVQTHIWNWVRVEKLSFSVFCCCFPVLIKKSIFRLANAFKNNGLLCVCQFRQFYFRTGKFRSAQIILLILLIISLLFFSVLLLLLLLFIKLVLFKVFFFFKIIFTGNNIKIHQKTQIRQQRKKEHYLHLHFFFLYLV